MKLLYNNIELKKVQSNCESCKESNTGNTSQSYKKNFVCDICDFSSKNENGLKIHVGKMHELECKSCKSIFTSETKLKDRMCRLHVSNPSNKSLYMKDWFVKDSCIRVYDSGQEKEIALLHSDYCDELKPCSDYPSVSLKVPAKF